MLVGNNAAKIERLVNYLKDSGWTVYDVEEQVLRITDNIPPEKIKLRIGTELKKWIKQTADKLILMNSNILYSPEMDKIGPFDEFKYVMSYSFSIFL